MDGQVRLDLNRCGVGVLEIVTEPELRFSKAVTFPIPTPAPFHSSADEVEIFLKKLRRLLIYNGVCDDDQDESAFRCDVNVSTHSHERNICGNKVELKHLSKLSLIKSAIEFEVGRQTALLKSGEHVFQETRGVDSSTGATFHLRRKEDAEDYRFMPDPDLPNLIVTKNDIVAVAASMPEHLDSLQQRLKTVYALSPEEIKTLIEYTSLSSFYEETAKGRDPKTAASWYLYSFKPDLTMQGAIKSSRAYQSSRHRHCKL
ncbi:hypothetical protein HDU97_007243 [Phlyctochytrium planicorne]|nr:hypothetical protein HDU97_007243 [Phlyctochytrium planicorne]